MAEKTLNTRIALRYDTYANWTLDNETTQTAKTGANFVLLKGEIGICEIPSGNANATTAPTVLFKVGDGKTPFKSLKWASALAADVYGWAKASDVRLAGKTIEFVGGKDAEGNDIIVKSIPLAYVTETEVKAITDPLTQRIANVEAKFTGDGSVSKQIEALDGRLDTVEGAIETLNGDADTAGSVAKAIAESAAATKSAYEAYADQAEADALTAAKAYVDGEGGVKQGLAAHIADKSNPHGVTAAQLGLGNVENKSVAEIKTELAANGTVEEGKDGFVTGGMVYTAVKAAQEAAEQKVNDLANGQVKTNAENIAKNAQAIIDEADAREAADNGIIERLEEVEAFFHTAEGETLDTALDTLVEIQEYLNGDGSATGGMIDRVASLEDEFKADGRVTVAEGEISGLKEAFAEYKEDMVDALAGKQDTIAANTYDAYGAADGVKNYVDGDFKAAVEKYADDKDLVVAKNAADALSAAVETLNAKDAELLQAIGTAGDDENAASGVYAAIAAAEARAKQYADDNDADTAYDDTAIKNRVKAIEDDYLTKADKYDDTVLAERVSAIETDYLKAADVLILNCGGSEVE